MSNTITIDLEDDATASPRSPGRNKPTAPSMQLVNQAVRNLLNLQEWQRRKIEAGIRRR